MNASKEIAAHSGVPSALPGVFLMTDSFQTGGSERQFVALAQSLDRSRFNVNLGCIQRRGTFLAGFENVPEFPLGGSAYGFHSMGTRLRLRRHLRNSQIKIVHAFDFYTNLTLIPAARIAGVPVIIGSQRQLGDLLTPAQARAQAMMFGLCDAVVCNSRAAARLLAQRGVKASRVVVIGNGLPDGCFAETYPALPKVPGKLRVGMIARMNSAAKNHTDFLHAAAQLHPRLPNVEFVLVGDGPLCEGLKLEAANLGIGGQTLFLGDRRDIPAVLASLDVSVMPSSSESLSNVIIESMAAGVPVVASNVGGNSELISEERGILTTPGDLAGLVKAIEALLRDEARRKGMADQSRKFARANFTIDRMRGSHETLYAELLKKKLRGAGSC